MRFYHPIKFKDNLRTVEPRFPINLRTAEVHFYFTGPLKKVYSELTFLGEYGSV